MAPRTLADHDVHRILGSPERWHSEGLGAAWGFPATGLGEAETGTEMEDEASEQLRLPGKAALLEYTRAAFDEVDGLLDGLSEHGPRQAIRTPQVGNDELASRLFVYLTHDSRHLGMIEAMRGVLGLSGSATN